LQVRIMRVAISPRLAINMRRIGSVDASDGEFMVISAKTDQAAETALTRIST
jgi:hypothetical protein